MFKGACSPSLFIFVNILWLAGFPALFFFIYIFLTFDKKKTIVINLLCLMASTSRLPLGAAPDGSSSSDSDPVLVESYFDEPIFEPRDGCDSTHRSSSTQPPLAPRPSMVSASLGVASPCAENPQDYNKDSAGVSKCFSSLGSSLRPCHSFVRYISTPCWLCWLSYTPYTGSLP
jgi:hypothetical protein